MNNEIFGTDFHRFNTLLAHNEVHSTALCWAPWKLARHNHACLCGFILFNLLVSISYKSEVEVKLFSESEAYYIYLLSASIPYLYTGLEDRFDATGPADHFCRQLQVLGWQVYELQYFL